MQGIAVLATEALRGAIEFGGEPVERGERRVLESLLCLQTFSKRDLCACRLRFRIAVRSVSDREAMVAMMDVTADLAARHPTWLTSLPI